MADHRFNMSMRRFLLEAGVSSQQAIERVARVEGPGGKAELKMKMLGAEGVPLDHPVEREIGLG